ncbi:hypothetical protein Fot_10868 [Forsythia ovata]|uniref:Uncharacterized protein n=1 Tax=Forsythia ovata TaxID=205694 RepID=A0ABD1WKQ1_9LAMI
MAISISLTQYGLAPYWLGRAREPGNKNGGSSSVLGPLIIQVNSWTTLVTFVTIRPRGQITDRLTHRAIELMCERNLHIQMSDQNWPHSQAYGKVSKAKPSYLYQRLLDQVDCKSRNVNE